MAEQEEIFVSQIKSTGMFSFKDYYKFCYAWLTEETELDLAEKKYKEKLAGDTKTIQVKWEGEKKVTDYFKYIIKVEFFLTNMKKVEVQKGNAKLVMDKGAIKTIVKGTLARDYDGKFEGSAFRKFMRSIYDKWVIPSRIDQMEDKLAGKCDEFLNQAKAYLDLEGKK